MLNDGRFKTSEEEANLVGSLLEDGNHAPLLDLDFPIQAEPSFTKDHYHLYINKSITWKQYRSLLKGFYKAGLLEWTSYIRAIQRGQTFVRKKGVVKEQRIEVTKLTYFITYVKVFFVSLARLIWWRIKEIFYP